jgi:hypothetical protein
MSIPRGQKLILAAFQRLTVPPLSNAPVLALESLLRTSKALEPQKVHQVLMLVPVLIVAVVFLISYPALMLD